jgi:cell division protease FtsH
VSYEQERSPFLEGTRLPSAKDFSEDTAREIDEAVRMIVGRAFDRSVQILTEQRALLEKSARELLQKETLGEEELRTIRAQLGMRPAQTAAPVA